MYTSPYDDMPGAITYVGGENALLDWAKGLSGTALGDWMSITEYNALKAKGYPIDPVDGSMPLPQGRVNMSSGKGRKLIQTGDPKYPQGIYHAEVKPYFAGDWLPITSFNFFKSKGLAPVLPMGMMVLPGGWLINPEPANKKLIAGIWHLKILKNEAPTQATTPSTPAPPAVESAAAGGFGTLLLLGLVAWGLKRR